eukprot:gb/GFBE01013740.1/.p1 GENE.gb/GFBE01013740.1/~~gb/GFBE01013740.1/.p1  ORF type:complete len:407 (+),score=66.88 gb/GFBE01013740.1/:1-1221(+)
MDCMSGALCMAGVTLGLTLPDAMTRLFPDQKKRDRGGSAHWPGDVSPRSVNRPAGRQWEVSVPPADYAADARGKVQGQRQVPSDVYQKASEFASVAGWEGFSMADARKLNADMNAKRTEQSPAEVLGNLQRGNARFWTGNATRPEKSAFERRALILQQFPHTAILGCSDSRVPVEVVFDQGLGDMFVVRVAGNCLDTGTTASLQYATNQLKVKVLVVMGHEGCGAVKAANRPIEQINQEPKALSGALRMLKSGLDEHRLMHIHDSRAHDREAVVTNVRRQIEQLAQDKAIMAKVQSKDLIIVGAFYEISSGIVDFFMEVTEAPDDSPAPRVLNQGVTRGVQSRLEFLSPKAGKRDVVLPPKDMAPMRFPVVSAQAASLTKSASGAYLRESTSRPTVLVETVGRRQQ